MIFRSPLAVQESRGAVRPAFEAIAETQLRAAPSDWYVTQPDHARISGELAAAFDPRKVPNVSAAVRRAIALHDMGWMAYDGDVNAPCAPKALESGVAVSFANSEPERFLPAWLGSIQASQSAGPLGGLMVSAHFAHIAQPYLESGKGTAEQRARVEEFRRREAERVDRLLPQAGVSLEEVRELIAVLQFCDLASLYFCSNPASPVELPQTLHGSQVRFSFEQGAFRMRPNLLDRVLEMEIPCVRFVNGRPERAMVPVKVQ